jgi:hypothetical protein
MVFILRQPKALRGGLLIDIFSLIDAFLSLPEQIIFRTIMYARPPSATSEKERP